MQSVYTKFKLPPDVKVCTSGQTAVMNSMTLSLSLSLPSVG